MKEWHIIHECDTENGTPTQWSKEINGQYVWIDLNSEELYEICIESNGNYKHLVTCNSTLLTGCFTCIKRKFLL